MFEGMSDDDEDFQPVSFRPASQHWTSFEALILMNERYFSVHVAGQPGGPLEQSGAVGGHTAALSEPQRCHGPSTDHAERASYGASPR